MSSHEKEQLLTTTIHIKSSDIYRTKNINGLIHNNLKKTIEGYCGKYGYVIPDTLKIIKRSFGRVMTYQNESKIEYDITYKIKSLLPCKNDIYECIIDNITKMGIVAYMNTNDEKTNNIKDSPILMIIPQEYIFKKTINDYSIGEKIDVEILDLRLKYRLSQIQTVAQIGTK